MIIETGSLSLSNTKFGSVTFTNVFAASPVVCCTLNTLSANLGHPNIYIRNVTSTGFELTASAKITAIVEYKAMIEN